MRIRLMSVALGALTLAACSDKQLAIGNPNSPTVQAAAGDPQALQLLATGLTIDHRGSRAGFVRDVGTFGREAFFYFPTDARYTSHYLIGIVVGGKAVIDPSGFASGDWGTQYNALRDNFNFRKTVAGANLSDAQKNAALGFARTLEAAELLEVIMTRDTLGAITEIKENAAELAPFVSRDSVYKYILATFDDAATKLAAGGSSFPISLHAGYAGFNTPATFATYTQALKARAAAYYATSGGGAAAWATALSALSKSFLNAGATTRAALDVGVYHIYSSASGDATNGLNAATVLDLYAHPSIQTDMTNRADGTPDLRYAAKIRTAPVRNAPQNLGISSSLGYSIWANASSPMAVVRNEELIALRAEAKLGSGDNAGAIADMNILRTVSGGLPASTLTAASSTSAILHGILYEKRYSTLMEGFRWVDMRRYGLLGELPLDLPTHFVAKVIPIPQAECLSRAGKTGAIAGPGC